MISQQRISVKIWKKIVTTSSYGKEWATYLLISSYSLVLAENEIKNH